MTDRAEIERLLNKTGRTLEGLPKQYSAGMVKAACERVGRTVKEIGNMLLHQSAVIELLVGALRDALDKPMQKPLTERELHALIDAGDDIAVYCESKNDDYAYAMLFFGGNNIDRDGVMIGNDELVWFQYGIRWRAWASRPTDEERRAAAWES